MNQQQQQLLQTTAEHLIRLAGYYTTAKLEELRQEYDEDYIQLSKWDQELVDKAVELAKSITELLHEG